MAFIHFTVFLEYFFYYIVPRWIGMDRDFIKEAKNSGIKLKVRYIQKEDNIKLEESFMTHEKILYFDSNPETLAQVFSWSLLKMCFINMLRSFKKQKYWTAKSYKKKSPIKCPKCGNGVLED